MNITAQNYPQQITPAILAKMPADAREMSENLQVNWNVLAYDPEFRDVVAYVVSEANKAAQPQRRRVNYKPAGGPVTGYRPFRSTVREVKSDKPVPTKTAASSTAKPRKARAKNAKSSTSKTKPKMGIVKKIGKALGTKKKASPKKAASRPKASAAKKAAFGGRKPDRRTVRSAKVKANNKKFGQIQDVVLNDFYQAGKRNAPKPSVKASYKKAARTLGLGRR